MPRVMIAVIPVLRSRNVIAVEIFFRYSCGSAIAIIMSASTTTKSGAKACIPTAAAHCPLARRVMAVVKPHPGQVIPTVDRIGHCHPFIPVATSINWVRPTPRKIPISQRLDSNGPSTGVKNHSTCRDVSESPEGAVFSSCPCAGLLDSTILAIRTCN